MNKINLFFIFISCTSIQEKNKKLLTSTRNYIQKEEFGEYFVNRNSGLIKGRNFAVKKTLLNQKNKKELEKSIVISKITNITPKIQLLLPVTSETTIYMKKHKYISKMEFDYKNRTLKNKTISSEKKWNKEHTFKLPKGNGNFCFYSNIIECLHVSGLFEKSITKGYGQMNFYLIWDAYPYFQEQFVNIPNDPFARASLIYDGRSKNGRYRFSLEVAGQTQFFTLNKNKNIQRHDWPSQNFSSTERSL